MKHIVLVCNMGMSTSALMKKMSKYAESIAFECTVNAYPVAELENVVDEADCILVGPQISYQLDNIKKVSKDVPVSAIPMQVYGMMDGKKVIEMAQDLMGKE